MSNKNYKLADVGFDKILVHKNDPGISRTLSRYKKKTKWPREPEFMEISSSEINKGDVVLDIGANIGFMTAFFSKMNGQSEIYALEPDPSNYKLLQENISLLGIESTVMAENIAVWKEDGNVELNISQSSNLHSIHNKGAGNTISIPAVSVSSFLKDKKSPSFIKMDVEGAEVEIFEGMKNFVLDTKHTIKILVELHPNYYSDHHSFTPQLEWYFKNGFKAKYLISATVAEPDFFSKKSFKPVEKYSMGGYSRGLYENLDINTIVEAINNKEPQKFYPPTRLNRVLSFFGLPTKHDYTNKIVRGLLLVRE